MFPISPPAAAALPAGAGALAAGAGALAAGAGALAAGAGALAAGALAGATAPAVLSPPPLVPGPAGENTGTGITLEAAPPARRTIGSAGPDASNAPEAASFATIFAQQQRQRLALTPSTVFDPAATDGASSGDDPNAADGADNGADENAAAASASASVPPLAAVNIAALSAALPGALFIAPPPRPVPPSAANVVAAVSVAGSNEGRRNNVSAPGMAPGIVAASRPALESDPSLTAAAPAESGPGDGPTFAPRASATTAAVSFVVTAPPLVTTTNVSSMVPSTIVSTPLSASSSEAAGVTLDAAAGPLPSPPPLAGVTGPLAPAASSATATPLSPSPSGHAANRSAGAGAVRTGSSGTAGDTEKTKNPNDRTAVAVAGAPMTAPDFVTNAFKDAEESKREAPAGASTTQESVQMVTSPANPAELVPAATIAAPAAATAARDAAVVGPVRAYLDETLSGTDAAAAPNGAGSVGRHRVTLRLNPDSLGEVRVRLETAPGGVVRAALIASTPDAHAALERASDGLRATLEARGLQVRELSVRLAAAAIVDASTTVAAAAAAAPDAGSGRAPQPFVPAPAGRDDASAAFWAGGQMSSGGNGNNGRQHNAFAQQSFGVPARYPVVPSVAAPGDESAATLAALSSVRARSGAAAVRALNLLA